MSKTLWDKLYGSQSFTTKTIALLPYFIIFLKTYLFLKQSQKWSKEKLKQYQTQKLHELIHHAYVNVPYYTRLFDDNGIKPDDIKELSDLQKIPVLTKELVRKNLNDLKARNYPDKSFEYVTTGGSTGIPLGLYYEKGKSRAIEWAFMKTQWDRVGYHFFNKCVYLKGATIELKKIGKYSLFRRWLILSSYDLTDNNLPEYIDKIRAFKPKFIQAYPSSIIIIAKYMKNKNIPHFDGLKAVFCGSENMYPGQRQLIEEKFGCRVYTWYGHAERVILGGECECSKNYHVFPEYGIFELVDDNGNSISNENQEGNLVGTTLTNFAMPLIRYKTDDLAFVYTKPCPCIRSYPLIHDVMGRWIQEFIIAPHNRKISLTALNMHTDIFDNVEQYQFYQDHVGEVILNIIPRPEYSAFDTEKICSEITKKLGDDVNFTVRFVEKIPRTEQGKYRLLIQKIINPIEEEHDE
jgi:phenylacetate-CoA ligase